MISSPEARAVLERHASTFSKAARLLPADVRDDMARLYAFCRFVDDTADEALSPETARVELDDVRAQLESGVGRHPLVATFLDLSERHDVPVGCALDLLDGVSADLGEVCVEDTDALIQYAWRVAGTVGVMSAGVLGVREASTLRFAADLGIGMQITNIARDVAEDLASGRQYVPTSLIAPEDLRSAVHDHDEGASASLHAALGTLLALADRYYASGERGIPLLRADVRWGILVAARSYRAIGPLVLARGPRDWERRMRTNSWQKAGHALSAVASLVGAAVRPDARPTGHDRSLHVPLRSLRRPVAMGLA